MPDFDFGTVLSVVKHVLQTVDGINSKSPQVNGCGCGCGCQNGGKIPSYVLTGLPVAIDTLIFNKIFLRPELDSKQLDALSSLFKDSDNYLHQLITLTDSIKKLLPANGAQDNNKLARLQLVKELETAMTKWSQNRQKDLLKVYGLSGVIRAGPTSGSTDEDPQPICYLNGEPVECPTSER